MNSNTRDYNQRYWQQYKKQRRRIYGSVSPAEYHALEHRANSSGRSVFQQLWQESQAYCQQRYLPSATLAQLQRELILEIRRIGNNLNQQTRYLHSFRRMVAQRQVFAQLQELEQLISKFTRDPPKPHQ